MTSTTKRATARRNWGCNMVRAATPGTHPLFVSMVRELIAERMLRPGDKKRWLGAMGPRHDTCLEGCCLPGK